MAQANGTAVPFKRPLDPSIFKLKEDEAQFFKSLTGIQDDKELKNHIIKVQTKAYEVHGYPCIHTFSFVMLKISHLPAYNRVLELSRTRPRAILLDIGCCFGADLRKIIADGWPVENAIASDLHPAFWQYGHELFASTPESFPAAFVPGDAFNAAVIQPREPFYSSPPSSCPTDLRTLTSLTPLQGHLSAIHASLLFHLFDEEGQLSLAKQLASLLSPEPGSVIFGFHGGKHTKGIRIQGTNARGGHMFCHSAESWKDLWDGQVFNKGCVSVEAKLVEREPGEVRFPERVITWLLWSVTRL